VVINFNNSNNNNNNNNKHQIKKKKKKKKITIILRSPRVNKVALHFKCLKEGEGGGRRDRLLALSLFLPFRFNLSGKPLNRCQTKGLIMLVRGLEPLIIILST
jgi:hypothetical protein